MPRKTSDLTKAARIAAKAVVRVQAHGYSETQIQSILDPRFVVTEHWTGSGFFIKMKNETGYILTNCHVARNASHLEIQSILTSDEFFEVEVIGLVEGMEPDVALLKLKKGEKQRFLKVSSEKKIPYLTFADSKKILRSTEIRAIGYPLGMNEPNVSGGEISNFISGSDEITERIVTDAPINPGNSGGPAIIQSGQVIGINTAIIAGANNIGFITPIHLIQKVLNNLESHHRTGICRLAATIQKNSSSNCNYLGMKKPVGVIVRKVFQNGLAVHLGLRQHDVILSINNYKLDRHGNVQGEKISRKRNLYDILYEIPLGDLVNFTIFRDGRIQKLKTKSIGWHGEGFPAQPILKDRQFICLGGLIIQEVCNEIANALSSVGLDSELAYQEFLQRKSKLIITHICDDSPSEDLDLSLGDFVVRAQGQAIKNLTQLSQQLKKSLAKKDKSFLLEFSSGALANFKMDSLTQIAAKIYKFGDKI